MKTALIETQTLHAGCSKAESKIFAPPHTPFPGALDGQNFNQLEMFTTFTTWKPSLAIIDARNFELVVTDPPTNRQDRLQYTAPQLARRVMM